jgi:5-methylcytosine-specific restriction endonuclease McrA
MRRRSPITRQSPIRRRSKPTIAEEQRAYAVATERARTAEGYLACEHCGRSLLDRDAERHHVKYRSRGGSTTVTNLMLLCRPCHRHVHRHACLPSREDFTLRDVSSEEDVD